MSNILKRICRFCSEDFDVGPEDLEFLEKLAPRIAGAAFELSLPTLCPGCRAQRRLVRRNERYLSRRNCGKCQRSMISSLSPDKPFTVYCHECWWSDSWDSLSYGREFDFSRPFFDQFAELQSVVPRLTLMNREAENSEYCNYAGNNKNCYLAVGGSWHNEDCLYGTRFYKSRSSLDCNYVNDSELCYEAIWGVGLYDCAFLVDSYHCTNCYFSRNLRSCTNCFFCSNLRNKSYHVHNKPVSKEEFERLRDLLSSFEALEAMKQQFQEQSLNSPRPMTLRVNCEDSSGDYLTDCKNAQNCFMGVDVVDGRNMIFGDASRDSYDCCCAGYENSELLYECVNTGTRGGRVLFSSTAWGCSESLYCDTIQNSQQCFGSVSLKHAKYCILNRQYSKTEYEQLVPQIIHHMRKTGEWGEFFPPEISPWGLNETLAGELFPLKKEVAISRGYRWSETDKSKPSGKVRELPDRIEELDDGVLNEILACKDCGKGYKVVPLELQLYRQLHLAVSRKCPDCRHQTRVTQRNPVRLWNRKCSECGKDEQSSYAPEREEKVLCEPCYLNLVQ